MTEFSNPDEETLAQELAIEAGDAFSVELTTRMSAGQRLLRQMATEQYWFGSHHYLDSGNVHRRLGTFHLGDDMFEHM